MPNPISQKHGVPIQKSIIFFIRILPVFFARVSPASQSANPACIKNTKIAATSTQITSVAEYITSPPFLFPGTKNAPQRGYLSLDARLCTGKGIYMDKKKSALEIILQSAFAFYGSNSTPIFIICQARC